MNSRQKEMLQISLSSEKEILKRIEANYKDALGEIETRIAILKGREDANLQHVIYQIEYQKQLKSQIGSILEQLRNNNFDSVSDYLTTCYEQGFLGTLYDLQGQGIPLIFPIDQEMVVAAIQHETKLSESLYAALGKDTKELSKKIASEISRGFSSNAMYNEIARNLAGYAGISKNNAMRIARTEGHRIQNRAIAHTQQKAKERGADIVKIWDAALDGKTRPHHRELDGQIRELDEPFVIAGLKAQEPGGFGNPAEDCNCRCRRISKARWLLGEEETKHIGNTDMMPNEELEPIAGKLGISVEALRKYSDEIIPVKARNYEDFKRQYDKIYNYRNTADFKKAQERIIGVKKGKTDVRVRSSAQKTNDIPGPPKREDFATMGAYARAKQKYKEQYGNMQKPVSEGTVIHEKNNTDKQKRKQLENQGEQKAIGQIMTDMNISKDEAMKIQDDMRFFTSNGYKEIRNPNSTWEKAIKARDDLEKYIANAPVFDGTIYRGTPIHEEKLAETIKSYYVGNVIDMGGISSWSDDKKVARDFATRKEVSACVIFKCKNKSGVGIKHLSMNSQESEVLQSGNNRYIIKSVKKTTQKSGYDGNRMIDIYEVEVEEK